MQNHESSDQKEHAPHVVGEEVTSADWIKGGNHDPRFNMPPGTKGKIIGTSTIHDWRVRFDYESKPVVLEVNDDDLA